MFAGMCQGVSGSWNALRAGEEQTALTLVGSVWIQQLPSAGEGVGSLVCDSRQELCDWNAALVPGALPLLQAQTPG